MAEGKQLEWSLGLRNHASGKYLTQESFGFAINAQGTTLRKKQIFYLEPGNDGKVFIRTHLGRYLYVKENGEFKGDAEDKSNDAEFIVEPQSDGTWALKSGAHGYYAHGTEAKLSAFTKELPADGKWVVHLAMHPQVNIMNVMRTRYIHLEEGELRCNEDVPWGADALITLVFFQDHPDGRYGLKASNGKYLAANGRLEGNPTPACQFLLGFYEDQISMSDSAGNLLTCIGAVGVMKTNNKEKVSKDELFIIQDSEPQFTITDNRGKYLSNRSSEEVKANQPDVTDLERFQLELDPSGKASFKNSKSLYWTVGDGNIINASAKDKSAKEAKFDIEWRNNRIAVKASNGNYLDVMSNGTVKATASSVTDTCILNAIIINRPQLVLRGQYGFVGQKGGSKRIDCNKPTYDVFDVECHDGAYAIKFGGDYWAVDGDGVHFDAKQPTLFYFEFVARSKFLIKTEGGNYLEAEQSGPIKAKGQGAGINTLWEY